MAGVLCGPAEARNGYVLKRSWHTLLPEVIQFMKCTFHLFPEPCLARAFQGPASLLVQMAHFRASHSFGRSRKAVSSRHDQDAGDMMQICAVGNPSGWC